ncbi:hypothetical protein GCM10020358_74850 [Amorphoplanes nipponensis]|uniref:Helix-turn-helix n=1 Tax=Actinoplanes nipponensis TaxID=135950 RepID=A0A919JMS6_9ACTN|nr:helix-turn-helix transcriptional regulator [Actinoplanes nipponensis]GIE52036.1 hypothetical protein Ani05nite_55700 [Actinoplanes nipponensis]
MIGPSRGFEEPDHGRHRAGPAPARSPKVPGGTGRPTSQALAREHEVARMRAKLMDPETAVRELAERLTFAHVNAGKPALGVLSEAVHYSKGTLSKVFAGKMLPSWPLVEDLAVELGVPTQTVVQEWFHLWTAANTLRRRPGALRERAAAPPAPGTDASAKSTAAGAGYTCPECGSWVVDPALHSGWHRQGGQSGGTAPGSVGGWSVQAPAAGLNRQVLGR